MRFIETENKVLEGSKKRDGRNSIDGEMCHMLFSECDNLRSENASIKLKSDNREAELKTLKRKLKDAESDLSKTQEKLATFLVQEEMKSEVTKKDERKPMKFTDLTPKSVLRKMIEELDKECGKCIYIRGCSSWERSGPIIMMKAYVNKKQA